MEEQSRQIRILVLIAAVFCAVLVGYNAFYVPEASFSEPAVTVDSTLSSAVSAAVPQKPAARVNINTATAAELSAGLPGVGDTIARRIVDYRTAHGLFHSAEELKNVPGIGEKKYEEIRDSVTVG